MSEQPYQVNFAMLIDEELLHRFLKVQWANLQGRWANLHSNGMDNQCKHYNKTSFKILNTQ